MKLCLPLIYHPTTVLIIDDDSAFLEELKFFFKDNKLKLITTNNFHRCLEISQQKNIRDTFSKNCLSYPDEEIDQNYKTNVNILNIHKEIYNNQRFDQISVIIVDYDMPGINGLDLLKSLKHIPAMKILLTGQADEKIAVNAFNEGIIQNYIQKHNHQLIDVLQEVVSQAQLHYFQKLTNKIENICIRPKEKQYLPFYQDVFKIHFEKFLKEEKIIEYYLLEKNGCFLCIDENGDHGIFSTYSSNDIEILLDSSEAESASIDNKNLLENGSYILCIRNSTKIAIPSGNQWDRYLIKATKLKKGNISFSCGYRKNFFKINRNLLKTFEVTNTTAPSEYTFVN